MNVKYYFFDIISLYEEELLKDSHYISHPLTNSNYYWDGDKIEVLNEDNIGKFYEKFSEMYDKYGLCDFISAFITKPYKLMFMRYFIEHYDMGDVGKVFGRYYTLCERPYQDYENIKEIYEVIKDKEIMEEEDKVIFDELPEMVTIYRGQKIDGYSRKSLSWTLSKDTALWFANRFGGVGYLLKAIVPKKSLWFYVGRINEEEVVLKPDVNIRKYVEIECVGM